MKQPNPTWVDIKQRSWAVMLAFPFIWIVAYGASRIVGARQAMWVAVIGCLLVVLCFGVIVGMCVIGSYGYDVVRFLRAYEPNCSSTVRERGAARAQAATVKRADVKS